VAAGSFHSCAVVSDGIRCWGYNGNGRLGNNTNTQSTTAVPVFGNPAALQVAAGVDHSCAVLSGGVVKCWGHNGFGQLGSDTTNTAAPSPAGERWAPTDVTGIDGNAASALAISAGEYFTCALMGNPAGQVWCWGRNEQGQLGRGVVNSPTQSITPASVKLDAQTNLTGAIAVDAGAAHACAIIGGAPNTMKCWGYDAFGQIGDGTAGASQPFAVTVRLDNLPTNLTGMVQIAAGGFHTCARFPGDLLRCWGHGGNGRLGNGNNVSTALPVTVIRLPTVDVFTLVEGGRDHSCAILSGGNMRCWGWNGNGRLGDGTNAERHRPVGVDHLAVFQ
jgi:alpha-tubulin suppressor-like RCC1 family protein